MSDTTSPYEASKTVEIAQREQAKVREMNYVKSIFDADNISEEERQTKSRERLLIEREREVYHDKGGTTKKIIQTSPLIILECDVFIPDHGSISSDPDLKDTFQRIPRPPKKFKSKM